MPLALTDECGVLLGVDEAFCSLTGLYEDEVLGRSIGCFVDADDVADDDALMRRLLAGARRRPAGPAVPKSRRRCRPRPVRRMGGPAPRRGGSPVSACCVSSLR